MVSEPTRERWQPLRAGLVDLFYYDIEEFGFHDGRLLLRGNNGTGKSKVLALTVPFLLDGELSAHRVEPDGDRKKRMEWNLLLGGEHPHSERLGYTWLEFGRRRADGGYEYRTIGCGLKAVAGRGIARHWFFVTSQRVGAELSLVGPARSALTREKLKEAVDGHGLVYDTASEYRRAVDETLFGLGTHRYEALVNLLIQLRQPQLSKRPDEKLLSRALTEALPPLDPALLSTVADAFRGLDEERETLRAFADAKASAESFLSHYGRYAQIAAKRRAAAPRLTHSRYEHFGRELGEVESAHAAATAEVARVEAELDALAATVRSHETRQTALNDSPEMRDARALDEVAAQARRLAALAASRVKDADLAASARERWQDRVDQARRTADEDRVKVERERERAEGAAAGARVADDHGRLVDGVVDDLDAAAAERGGTLLVQRQSTAVAELQRRNETHARAEADARKAHGEVDRLTGEQQQAIERITAAEAVVGENVETLVADYRRYLAGVTRFRVPGAADLLEALAGWAHGPDGPNPAAVAVADAVMAATESLAHRQAAVNAERDALTAERTALADEVERLEAGGHDAPPAPHTRAPGSRDDRDGAPLWRVVDFQPGLPDADRAGLEAALEASGVLDAWVTPDGDLVRGDTVVVSGDPVGDGDLTAVLAPAVNRADPHAATLTDDAVAAVLRSIGLGPGATTWVDVDGRYAVGVLAGEWTKAAAGYLGEGAREAARRVRLRELRGRLTEIAARLDELAAAVVALADERAALSAEGQQQPSDAPLRAAHVKVGAEHEAKRRVDARLAEAVTVAAERAAAAGLAREHAAEFAGDVGLPLDPAELAAVRSALDAYRFALAGLWPELRALQRARRDLAEAEQELNTTAERAAEAAEEAAIARAEAEDADERHRVLQETAGAAVAELYAQLATVKAALVECATQRKVAEHAERRAREARGNAAGRREQLTTSIAAAAAEREAAISQLRSFAATGLLAMAVPTVELPDPAATWAPNPAIALARAINTALDDVDDGDRPWELAQDRVTREHKLLTDALSRHGHRVGMVVRAGILVVDVLFQGHSHDIPALVAALESETGQRAALLSAKEREILENHLVNEVAGTLQELIGEAETQVRSINENLAARPTSTGMRLRLVWRTARGAPDGLERVRTRLLRQTSDAWSADDRAAVGGFLQEQIEREHAEDVAGGWTEQLTRALDYRSWHEFVIQRHQDGQWRPASGPASGGERVLAATVPLFAAASSFYDSSGNPHAPRLIALDEAFAGVDDDSRAKCLGLLAAFDLDVVMTSEREWGCYPQVPGLAIAQLARREGIDAVLVTPWRWDGRERLQLARPVPYVPTE